MSTVRVKICGLKTKEEALAAAEEGADAAGFVFADSPRRLTPEKAAAIIRELPPFFSKIGVFVDENPEVMRQVARYCGLDTLQLHGRESADCVGELQPWKIIKAFAAASRLTVEECASYSPAAVLLDTSYKNLRGGGGRTFDWELAAPFARSPSFYLIMAGGLNPENVFSALSAVRPYGVDVSSGVEENGSKSRLKIRSFIKEIRRWEELHSGGTETKLF